MCKYFHFFLAFLAISLLISGESEAENETNEDESNETSSNDNETNDNTTSGNNETNEESGFCPAEITDENKDDVDDACIATFDEPEDSNSKVEELLSSWSFFASICVIAIIAFRRR
jgi:hypothetical protein|tara:strand:- start:1503 stop:1850 length:348 start_codon:yes stop_codon:yes gene_type:complete